MTERYKLVCSTSNHAIYLANVNPMILGTQTMTKEAIEAVRDYMVGDINKGESSVGYSWKRGDGKTVKLVCIVEETNEQKVDA